MATNDVEKLFAWLAETSAPASEQILATALIRAESPYFERIIAQLLERGTDQAWAGLIGNFPRLGPEVRARLLADSARLRAGCALAMRSSVAQVRKNTLTALQHMPCPRLSYLLPDALRDTSDEVRRTAALTLRRLAESVLDSEGVESWDDARQREYWSSRTEVAQAVREALRTFDLHFCREVVEISLWFAEDFADALWKMLGNPRSQGGFIVSASLDFWDSPRLARFLLDALAQPAWRNTAQLILQGWHTPAELGALLGNSDVLANPEIRRRLGTIKHPRWFDGPGYNLTDLPSSCRARAAQWVYYLGYRPQEKMRILTTWLEDPDPALRRGAACALAMLGAPDTLAEFENVADDADPMATFARSYVAGRADESAVPTPAEAFPVGRFEQLWQECREKALRDDAQVIGKLCRDLPARRHLIVERLRSARPGDRLLALRVICASERPEQFSEEVAILMDDPVESIRRIARSVRTGINRATGPAGEDTSPSTGHPQGDQPAGGSPVPDSAEIREDLRRLLVELLATENEVDEADKLVEQVRTALRCLPHDTTADAPGRPEVRS